MDCAKEVKSRVEWIKSLLKQSNANGIVFGNSGGKDCVLVGILSKMATENVTSIIMPCESSRNYGEDRNHALKFSSMFNINTIEIDLTATKKELNKVLEPYIGDCPMAYANINPRLRMTTLYSYAYKNNCLVAGTGNRSEIMTGYFTKWGDGGYDFNPISDLTVTEVYKMLNYLKAPIEIIEKKPSAGLYEGQTDEQEIGLSYNVIDEYLLNGTGKIEDIDKLKSIIQRTEHKRKIPKMYKNLS